MTEIEEQFYKILKNKIDIAYMDIEKGYRNLVHAVRDIPSEWLEEFRDYIMAKGLIVFERKVYEEFKEQKKNDEETEA